MAGTSQGVYTQLRWKRQTVLKTIATGGTGGQIVRRKTAGFDLKRDTYNTTDELASHQQMISERQGVQMVDGKASTFLSAGTHSDWFSALLRKDFVAGATTGAIITVTAAVTSGAAGTYTRSSGSYLTDGFKVGDVISWTGWATTGVPNNAHNALITALTATVMTVLNIDGVAVGAKAAGDSVTGTVRGKKTMVPDTGHTNIYYTMEMWDSLATISEVSQDCKVGQAAIKIPGNGNAEVDFTIPGLDQTTPGTAAYFTSPTAETSSNVLAAATGALIVNGAVNAVVTGINMTIDGQETPAEGVVGTRVRPDIFRKKVLIKGSFTAYFSDSVLDNLSRAETEINLICVLADSSLALAEFVSFNMPRIKLQTSSAADAEIGRIRTFNFTALYNSTGGVGIATDKTTLAMQDSLAP